jgi:hypothetical protein
MVSISRKKPYRGMVECEAIIFIYVLSNLKERRNIKCPLKVAPLAVILT